MADSARQVKRLHFSTIMDICLLKEVLRRNPHCENTHWEEVAQNFSEIINISCSNRTAKDRTLHLINLFKKDNKISLRNSGTEEEYSERDKILQEICDRQLQPVQSNINVTNEKTTVELYAADVLPVTGDELRVNIVTVGDNWDTPVTTMNPPLQAGMSSQKEADSPKGGRFHYGTAKRLKTNLGYLEARAKIHSELRAKELDIRSREADIRSREVEIRSREVDNETKRLQLREMELQLEERRLDIDIREKEARLELEARNLELRHASENNKDKLIDALISHFNK